MNLSLSSNKHTGMVIQTKSVLKYVLYCNIVIEILHFDELGT